jgi:putative endonuclease
MYYVYILHSSKDGKLYTGFTPDLKKRIKAHEGGFVQATKHRRPLVLIHYEGFLYSEDARRREKYLKGGNGKQEMDVMLKTYFKKKEWKK